MEKKNTLQNKENISSGLLDPIPPLPDIIFPEVGTPSYQIPTNSMPATTPAGNTAKVNK